MALKISFANVDADGTFSSLLLFVTPCFRTDQVLDSDCHLEHKQAASRFHHEDRYLTSYVPMREPPLF